MKNKQLNKKVKRRITFLSCAIFLLIGIIVANVFNYFFKIIHNLSELAFLNANYDTLLHEEESLQSEITKLQDSNYVARYAREKYLYSLPDEVIIKLPDTKE